MIVPGGLSSAIVTGGGSGNTGANAGNNSANTGVTGLNIPILGATNA